MATIFEIKLSHLKHQALVAGGRRGQGGVRQVVARAPGGVGELLQSLIGRACQRMRAHCSSVTEGVGKLTDELGDGGEVTGRRGGHGFTVFSLTDIGGGDGSIHFDTGGGAAPVPDAWSRRGVRGHPRRWRRDLAGTRLRVSAAEG